MRSLILLTACIAGALLAGPLLAFPLYALPPFAAMEFQKVVPMATEFAAIVAGFLFLHATAGLDRRTLGFAFSARDLRRDLPVALLAGIVFVAALQGALLLLGINVPSPGADVSAGALARLLFAALGIGVVVAIVEETLFRGALLGGLHRANGAAAALLATSAVYAVVHFIKFPPLPAGAEVRWYTGLELLSQAFWRFGSPIVISSIITLFALGVLLGLMRLARGHIAQCIGFHAGVVAGLKIAGDLTDYRIGARFDFLVNRWDPELGWLAILFIAALTASYAIVFLRERRA
jgi:membrane protease YdiL (CAAX protease family)